MTLSALYQPSLALLTDLYQLTMALGYWRAGRADDEAVFHLYFRRNPFQGGYALACGLARVAEFIEAFRFAPEDIEYLSSLSGHDGSPLFPGAFLTALAGLHLDCDVEAVPEGTVVFAHEPLLRVRGSLLQCQLLETALLTFVNFETLIATKAARICHAARGEPVLEFGLRRAQGVDGALSASRAAYVGGTNATSNVLAGRLYGIPVKGTHAHSWVMSFEDELTAFNAYADAMPNNCVFLVDTYDTVEGVRNAIQVGERLRARGQRLLGVRLDSGDLAYLSTVARRLLDAAGFADTFIVGSNDLDELTIQSLKLQDAKIAVWGVGTKLVTAFDQPALGGVYKLTALKRPGGAFEHKLKVSDHAAKTTTPGILQIRRFINHGEYVGDMIFDQLTGINLPAIVDPKDPTRQKRLPREAAYQDLLVPLIRQGRRVAQAESLAMVRSRAQAELAHLHGGIKRFENPHEYPVGLEPELHALKARMIFKTRGVDPQEMLSGAPNPPEAR